ncbi:MAG: SCO family protein [Taibaiella sp.]|nr:SCO family protein [Taibaiella sp.]
MAVAVLLPLSCYLVVSKLSKGKVIMPKHYVIESIAPDPDAGGRPDTTYHAISELTLTNQMGRQVSVNKDLTGKMLVIDFFFADCNATCPKLTKSMRLLQNSFRKDPKKETSLENEIQFISITVMPERDSFQVMRKYADRYDANHDHWWFLTGDKQTIYNFARKDLGLTTGEGDGGADDFIHSDKLVLIDKDRFIRGYYNGLNDTDVRKCADDIVLLTLERKHKKKVNK